MLCYTNQKACADPATTEGNVKSHKVNNTSTFSTTPVHCFTKLKGHRMRLNLIAEPTKNNQVPHSTQCIPSYCNLVPDSNRVKIGFRNISVKISPFQPGLLSAGATGQHDPQNFLPQRARCLPTLRREKISLGCWNSCI